MFIELTDHLRCPEAHAEAFLVLLPDTMDGRDVLSGHLACPVCGWAVDWTDGVPDFGAGWRSATYPAFDADGAHAMLGIDGPGGWVALVGAAGVLATDLAPLLPGVLLVAVNPPASVAPDDRVSVVLSGAWPIKTHAMRGVVLGPDTIAMRDAALGSVLPGLRVVGQGAAPQGSGVEMLAHAGDVWVAKKR